MADEMHARDTHRSAGLEAEAPDQPALARVACLGTVAPACLAQADAGRAPGRVAVCGDAPDEGQIGVNDGRVNGHVSRR